MSPLFARVELEHLEWIGLIVLIRYHSILLAPPASHAALPSQVFRASISGLRIYRAFRCI